MQVKGKSDIASIYEVFDSDPPELKTLKLQSNLDFQKGLAAYFDKDFITAAVHFKKTVSFFALSY